MNRTCKMVMCKWLLTEFGTKNHTNSVSWLKEEIRKMYDMDLLTEYITSAWSLPKPSKVNNKLCSLIYTNFFENSYYK